MRKKTKIILSLLVSNLFTLLVLFFLIMSSFAFFFKEDESSSGTTIGGIYTGEYTEELPSFPEIKGTETIPDEVAQFAVGTAVKYNLLPSVIISQWAYESEWARSLSAKNDTNFFGITWFAGCPFPQGTARGIGGSEGGWYMKFPNKKASFSYYGFMVASQKNFNACVRNTSPSECLLILGRGGYAAAGITEDSTYFTSCMSIINNNKLTNYDEFAKKKWQNQQSTTGNSTGKGTIDVLEKMLGIRIYNGQCYLLTAYYVEQIGGPTLRGSGKMFACTIGSDYDWSSYGWTVIFNPRYSDLRAGDIINYKAFSTLAPSMYGHTGVIASIDGNGHYQTYEQNASQGQICAKYSRNFETNILSIVRKVK